MDDDDFDFAGPEEGDYQINPCGPLGGQTCAGEVGGKSLGRFKSDAAALKAICKKMASDQFWPNVWNISDHGNASVIDPNCTLRQLRPPKRKTR